MIRNGPCFEKLYQECCDIICRSNDINIKFKQEKLDAVYTKLCDTDDYELQEFYSIVHELKTFQYMKDNDINIEARNDTKVGPDFECNFGYLECISVTKGKKGTEGRDYVDRMLAGSINRHKSEIPRISSAIKDKMEQYEKYLQNKNILSSKPRIIVLGTSMFANEFQSSSCIEDTMKILYAIGDEFFTFNIKSKSFIETPNNQNRVYDNIGKKTFDKDLEFDYFFQNEYKNISAVILICNSLFEKIERKFFKVFLNPFANIPVDKSLLSKFDYFTLVNIDDNIAVYEWNK